MKSVRCGAVVALAVLAVPAVASAHPSVYKVTPKVAPGGDTFNNDPTGANLTDGTPQYVVASDGYAIRLTNNNTVSGVQADGTAGVVNFSQMPGSWRAAPMTAQDKLAYAPAQTDVQAHATCTDSTLNTPANVWAWQQRSDNDPFFNYIPWQKTSAGLGDDPSTWIALIKNLTGIDLSTLPDSELKAACENPPVSGHYHAADQIASITTAMIADAVSPLQSQVSQLQNQVGVLQAGKTASDAAAAAAATEAAAAKNRPLTLTLSAKKFDTGVAMVTGAPGTAVTVKMLLSSSAAKKLKISRTISSKKATLDAQGAELLTLTSTRKAARAISKHGHAQKVTIQATGGGKTLTSKGTLR